MELVLVGFSHKNAPAAVREALALLAPAQILEDWRAEIGPEAVVLSTCNRFEIYFPGESSEKALNFLKKKTGVSLKAHAYVLAGPAVARHLFEVAAGLDSLVVGETEILGQVKTAYELAKERAMTGKAANVLFQRALYVGKMARNDTGIAAGQTSVASVAVQLAESIFGGLRESEVLVLGAGAMAESTAKHLLSKKVARLTIANRTKERAEDLARRIKAEPLVWENFPQALSRVDIVISSTGSDRPVLTREIVSAAMRERSGRSLFVIDIAMPRDVEETVHGLDHVYLYRLEDLESIVAENLKTRGGEVEKARKIVSDKARDFSSWAQSAAAGREISLKHSTAGL